MKMCRFQFAFRIALVVLPATALVQGQSTSTPPPIVTTPITPIDPSINVKPSGGASQTVAVPATPGASALAPLINISTRTTLAAGQTLTSGFVVGSSVSRRVLIRAIGTTLTNFGVTQPLADPRLTVFKGATAIASNDDWGGNTTMSALFAAIGAFPLPPGSLDSAIVVTLTPGNYSVQVSSVLSLGTGEVLLEIYFID